MGERLKLKKIRAVFRLVGELRELGGDPNQWRPHMVKRLRRIVKAQIVVSSEIHFINRNGIMKVIDSGWICDDEQNVWKIHNERDNEKPETYWLNASAPHNTGGDTLVPVSPTQKVYGGSMFILSQAPLPHLGTVDQLGLHRAWGQAPFTRAEHKLIRILHLELARLWSDDALKKARDATHDMAPSLAQTLNLLLEGKSEKEIAFALKLSPHTVHNYVKALHQRFEVCSRGELLAKVGKQIRSDFRPKLSAESGEMGQNDEKRQ